MASPLNNQLPSTGASSTSGGIMTPTSSTDTASHASAAVSNYSTADASHTPHPSYQLLAYLAQPATLDGPVYGRLAGQPADEHARIAFHTARAQRNNERFDQRFRF